MAGDMIQQTLFKEGGAYKIIAIDIKFDHCNFDLNPAPLIQQMGQRNAALFLRQFISDQLV